MMRSNNDFDYNLWKDNKGNCFVRVKSTGEVSEVSVEVLRLLRLEEVRTYREKQGIPVYVLKDGRMAEMERCQAIPLEFIENDIKYTNNRLSECENNVFLNTLEAEIKKVLTVREYFVYRHCLIQGKRISQYAQEIGVSQPYISKLITKIRKKIKNLI